MRTSVVAACMLLGTGGALAGQVTSYERFQYDDKGTFAQVLECSGTQCDVEYQSADGTVRRHYGVWNEDLARYRDTYLQEHGGDVAGLSCDATDYNGQLPGYVEPSTETFAQLVRDYFTSVATPGFNVSVTVQSIQPLQPYINSRGYLAGQGALLQNNGAPENATVYPFRARFSVCEETSASSAETYDNALEFHCFVEETGGWTCGSAGTF